MKKRKLSTFYARISIKNKPLISVITVVYNRENSIGITIESVINQSYNNLEFIIIDGGSNDKTLDVINSYGNKINYLISEKDNGIYDAMNKGIQITNGDWIIFMNAGDTFYNNNIINDIVPFLKNKNYNYFGDYYDVSMGKIVKQNNFKDVLFMNICHQSIFYSKFAFRKRRFNTKYTILADWEFNMYQYKFHNFVYFNYIIAKYEGNGISLKKRDIPFMNDRYVLIYKYYGLIAYIFFMIKRLFKHFSSNI